MMSEGMMRKWVTGLKTGNGEKFTICDAEQNAWTTDFLGRYLCMTTCDCIFHCHNGTGNNSVALYNPDLARSCFYLILHPKKFFAGLKFESGSEIKENIHQWFKSYVAKFCEQVY